MPNAEQYDRLARDFDAHHERSATVAGAIDGVADPASLSSTFIAALIDEAVRQIETNSRRGSAETSYIAEVCRGRARICQEYDEAYRRYEIAADNHDTARRSAAPGTEVGMPPRPPQRPRPWAELSR